MPRTARQKSENRYYHVILRGIGRQILFEDVQDNERFLSTVLRYRQELGFGLVAWCMMDNHVHLLIHDVPDQLDLIMKKIAGSYAIYYNRKYDRFGHLFQDRYMSEAVDSDEYLLTVVRYIHRNPEKAGIAKAEDYRWSSYGDYLSPGEDIDNALALELIGGPKRFADWMRQEREENCLDIRDKQWIHDDEARKLICDTYKLTSGTQLQELNKKERDAALRWLKARGLTVRQLERLTGINRGVIQMA
ncbi:MAG: transposase [Clostridia bacterium]|nr:transposase [Clostridia bacterium]MBR6890611.1 transposase [Clostridia bacterium]